MSAFARGKPPGLRKLEALRASLYHSTCASSSLAAPAPLAEQRQGTLPVRIFSQRAGVGTEAPYLRLSAKGHQRPDRYNITNG